MTPNERNAAEAKRLLNEPLLVDAFETVKMNAMLALIEAEPNDIATISKHQAIARCIDEVLDALSAVIHAGGNTGGGVAIESEPPA